MDYGPTVWLECSPEQLKAIGATHGIKVKSWQRLESLGIINTIYVLNDHFVLRIPRNAPNCIEEAYTESVAVPIVVEAGLQTPRLLAFDTSCELLPVPYTIYEKAPGVTWGVQKQPFHTWKQTCRDLAQQLALLHTSIQHTTDPQGYLEQAEHEATRDYLPKAVEYGLLNQADQTWLERWLDHLQPAFEQAMEPVFLHNDIHPHNILVYPEDRLSAILDWSDAGWGDVALEFVWLPLQTAAEVLKSYREIRGSSVDEYLEERIIWNHLGIMLRRLKRGSGLDHYGWGSAPAARIFDLLRASRSLDDSRWQRAFRGIDG